MIPAIRTLSTQVDGGRCPESAVGLSRTCAVAGTLVAVPVATLICPVRCWQRSLAAVWQRPNDTASRGGPVADASAWVVLAGALGGVALTGALGLVTAAQTHRWNERTRVQTAREQEVRDLRDQRRQASHSYLVATNEFYLAVDQVYLKSGRGEHPDPDEHRRAEIKELQNAYVELTITAGAEVRKRARAYNK